MSSQPRRIPPVDRLYRETETSLFTQHVASDSKRQAVADLMRMKHGGMSDKEACNKFVDQLELVVIDDPKDPALNEAYRVYVENFPIKEEQESKAGFKEVLGYNHDPAMKAKYGNFQEKWICARDPNTKKIIGGINFSTYGMSDDPQAGKHVDGTQHMTYLFVSPEYRSLGIAKKLIAASEDDSKEFLAQASGGAKETNDLRLISFNEQNQPARMSLYNYFFDTKNAQIDQCDRLAWWEKRGFKPLDFRYVQPPLEKDGEACFDLALNAKTGGKPVPSSVIVRHLDKFFSMSVLKNKPANDDPHFQTMAEALKSKATVGLVKTPDYPSLKKTIWAAMKDKSADLLGSIKQGTIGSLLSAKCDVPDRKAQFRPPAPGASVT